MALNYENLDDRTRAFMSDEIARDIASGTLYKSKRFTEQGIAAWPGLLDSAVNEHDDSWLANEIQRAGYMRTHEERNRDGVVSQVKVPVTAGATLSEGEFNRFYARGVCRRAVEDGIEGVIAYRARHSDNTRPESEAIVGKTFNANSLLADLRSSQGMETVLGLPPGPNSGLSVRLP